jgi:hypothetical protein
MTVTPTDVRQWLFRYLQGHMSWFDSPDWEVPGDKTIPRLVKAFEQLADYVATPVMMTRGSSLSPTR